MGVRVLSSTIGKIFDAVILTIVVAIAAGGVFLGVAAIVAGFRLARPGLVLVGIGIAIMAVHYVYYRHPNRDWRVRFPLWFLGIGVGLVAVGGYLEWSRL